MATYDQAGRRVRSRKVLGDVIYDAMGNSTGFDDSSAPTATIQPTADPSIVKVTVPPGGSIPSWVSATSQQPDGSVVGYGPTNEAQSAGYFQAAVDTVAALPSQIAGQAQTAFNALGNVGQWVVIAAIALVAFELINEVKARRPR